MEFPDWPKVISHAYPAWRALISDWSMSSFIMVVHQVQSEFYSKARLKSLSQTPIIKLFTDQWELGTEKLYHIFQANQQRTNLKFYSRTQCESHMNRYDWPILAGNEKRIVRDCLNRSVVPEGWWTDTLQPWSHSNKHWGGHEGQL